MFKVFDGVVMRAFRVALAFLAIQVALALAWRVTLGANTHATGSDRMRYGANQRCLLNRITAEIIEGSSMFYRPSKLPITLIVAAILLHAPSARAETPLDADNVKGWCFELTLGGEACSGDPITACKAQFDDRWVDPSDVFLGAGPTEIDLVYECLADAFAYLEPVVFKCEGGATEVMPYTCQTTDDATSCDVCAGNPVEVISGRKMEGALDFETSDGLLRVRRDYTSRRPHGNLDGGVMPYGGAGWSFDFGPQLTLSEDFGMDQRLWLNLSDGRQYGFVYDADLSTFVPVDSTADARRKSRFRVTLAGGPPVNWATISSASSAWTVEDRDKGVTYTIVSRKRPSESYFVSGMPTTMVTRSGYSWTASYGSHAEITSITDVFGRTLTFSWNIGTGVSGATYKVLIKQIVLPDGTALNYSYRRFWVSPEGELPTSRFDVLTKVEHVISPTGSGPSNVLTATTYHYEDGRFPYHLTGITDGRGLRYATWTYDGAARVTESFHGTGQDSTLFEYDDVDATTRERTITNALGKEAIYSFSASDAQWLLTSVNGPASANTVASTSTSTYTDKLVATQTDEEGRVTRYLRDAQGMPTSVEEADGTADERISTYTWRTDRQVDLAVRPGLTTDYVYDSAGLLISVTETDTTSHTLPYSTNGQTRSWAYTYTTEGLLASVDGPLPGTDDTVSYTYDTDGYLASVTDELGHVTTIVAVDGLGRPLEIEDPNGIVTEFAYDPLGHLESVVVDPTGAAQTTDFEYDQIGQLTNIEMADGSSFAYVYDAARRLISVTDASGNVAEYTYDDMGNATLVEIADVSSTLAYTQASTFDELGRLLTRTGVNSATWTNAYDKVSNLVEATDPRANSVEYAYNGLNQLIETVDEANHAVDLTNDPSGRVVSHLDPRLIETTYVRNGWGEVIEESSPDIGTVVYERNALGLVTEKTNGRGIPTEYAYDQAGRQTAVSYPWSGGEDGYFAYDDTTGGNFGLGRLTGFGNAAGDTTLTYDSAGQLTTEALSSLNFYVTTNYAYDDAGNIEEIVYPSGRVVTYARDADGLLESVSSSETASDPPTVLADEMEWMPFGELFALSYGNGLDWERSFNTDYRLTQQVLSDGLTPILKKSYVYGDDLNLTGILDDLDPSRDETYSYTANNRLETADGPWGEDTFGYDGVGNITSHVNVFGGVTTDNQATYSSTANHMASIAQNGFVGRTFAYDANGNVKTDTVGGTTTTYFYNNADRMYALEQGGTRLGEYYYNLRGQLVLRFVTNTVPSGWYAYFYDQDGHLIAEHDGSTGAPIREYVWLGDIPVAVIEAGTSPTVYWIHPDHLGRPIAMTDAAGAFVNETTWVAFGGIHVMTGSIGLDLRFPGQWYQHEGGLHYNWHRSYDPTIARYTQPDPLGLVDGPSRYAYVGSDPLQRVDPSGTQSPLTGPPNTAVWVSTTTLRYYDANGMAAFDIDCPGTHGFLEVNIWTGKSRGKTMVGIPFIGK